MRERSEQVRGTLHITSRLGFGTEVQVVAPLARGE